MPPDLQTRLFNAPLDEALDAFFKAMTNRTDVDTDQWREILRRAGDGLKDEAFNSGYGCGANNSICTCS